MSGRPERCPLAGHPKSFSLTEEDLLLERLRCWRRGSRQGPLQNTQVHLVEELTGLIDRPGGVHFGLELAVGIRRGEPDNYGLGSSHEAASQQGFRRNLAGHDVLDDGPRMLAVRPFRVEGAAQLPHPLPVRYVDRPAVDWRHRSAPPDGVGEERLLLALMLFDLGAQPGNAFLEGFLQGAAQTLRSLGELRPLVVEQIEPRFL